MLIDVVVIAVCAALVVAGVVLVVRWGSGRAEDVATRSPVRSALLTIAAGAIAGVLGAGAGGRLVMRLLALTSPDSEGQITEGGAAIGAITVGGTLGFFVFVGAAAGVLSALLYVLVGSLLPRGRAGGVVLGVVLLLLAGTRLDPLRADNFDFNLVGPDWLSLLSFTCLVIFQGMLMWALAGRLNLRPLPIGRRALTTGRIAGGVLVLAAAPGFVSAVSEILDHS